jgi:hypothetical protein
MKTIRNTMILLFAAAGRLLDRGRELAGNETELMLANAGGEDGVFAVLQGDSFFVPYGNYPHKQGLQKLDRKAADAMAANHGGLMAKFARLVTGGSARYPVYIGHPDLPGSKDTDKRAYAWIENVVPEETGVRFPVKWSEPGQQLVANGHFRFYSPLWWTKKIQGGVMPVSLKSMGLTNDPNIPVPALANETPEIETQDLQTQDTREEEESFETETPMKDILLALGLEDGATQEDAVAKIVALKSAAAAAETSGTKATEAEAARGVAENELAVSKAAVTALEGKLKLAANTAVQTAVLAGRITPADAEGKVTEILAANDFETALADLAKMRAKFKTVSKTGDLGQAKTRLVVAANDEGKAAREERAQLVANEYAATNPALPEGERKRIAWQRAQRKTPEAFSSQKDSSGSAA